MDVRITASELARRVGDVLGRVRYRGDSFTVLRNGEPVARVVPVPSTSVVSTRDAVLAWLDAGGPDLDFADDLELVNRLDRPPESPWDS